MWKELKPYSRTLPVGVITVQSNGRIRFNVRSIRSWGLDKYKAMRVLQDSAHPRLIAFQLLSEPDGKSVAVHNGKSSKDISAIWLLKELDIEKGRYLGRKDKELIIVDFSTPLTNKQLGLLGHEG